MKLQQTNGMAPLENEQALIKSTNCSTHCLPLFTAGKPLSEPTSQQLGQTPSDEYFRAPSATKMPPTRTCRSLCSEGISAQETTAQPASDF